MEKKLRDIAILETLSIFILCFFAGLCIISYTEDEGSSAYNPSLAIAIIHGVIFYFLVILTHPHTGAHLNPGVSLALFVTKKINQTELITYLLSHTTGSIVAGIALRITSKGHHNTPVSLGEPKLDYFLMDGGYLSTIIVPFLYEFIGSFILMLVIYAYAVGQKQNSEIIAKGIATVVVAMALSIGK